MVKVNDLYFDSSGFLYRITFMTNYSLRWAKSSNHIEFIPVCIDFRIEEIERQIQQRILIPYTRTNWILYGKEKN